MDIHRNVFREFLIAAKKFHRYDRCRSSVDLRYNHLGLSQFCHNVAAGFIPARTVREPIPDEQFEAKALQDESQTAVRIYGSVNQKG
jgi:hypothetical protein